MRVAYLDLNYTTFFEDYSIAPKRYGGGRVFAAWCKELFDFRIFGCPEVFDNVKPTEAQSRCCSLSPQQIDALQKGFPLAEVSPQFYNIDLFITPYTDTLLNLEGLRAKQCVWSVGLNQPIHEKHEHLLLYNDYQVPILRGPKTRIHKFTLGIEMPPAIERKKEDFIFQCSRHVTEFSSIEVAEFCKANKIKVYFAGPIREDYPLLKHIDNKYAFYLGEVTEAVKRDYLSRARLCTLIHNWQTPFSLSAVEALAYGTPVACAGLGFWHTLIDENRTGYTVSNNDELMRAWELSKHIQQRDCIGKVAQYNHLNMAHSVMECCREILDLPASQF